MCVCRTRTQTGELAFKVMTQHLKKCSYMKLNMAYLDKGSNDTQTGKAEILKWSSFAHRVKKWVQEQGNVD